MSNVRTNAAGTFGILILTAGISGCGALDDFFDDWGTKHPPQPTACASTASCPAGTVCSVENGVCNSPPGCDRDGAVCPAVCYGTCEKAPAPPAECRSDADCRAVSYMCTGCECLALGPNEKTPTCSGPGVQCFADPCLNKGAVCDAGQCRIKTGTSCPAGSVQQKVCLQCGPAGGCAKEAECARRCTQNADCAADQTACTAGVCQVVGCI